MKVDILILVNLVFLVDLVILEIRDFLADLVLQDIQTMVTAVSVSGKKTNRLFPEYPVNLGCPVDLDFPVFLGFLDNLN